MYKKLDDDTLNTVLETGIDEFAANGLDRANINVIAKKSGVSVGVIYKYYGDKDNFFLACVRHSLKLLEQVLRDTFSDETDVMTCIRLMESAKRSGETSINIDSHMFAFFFDNLLMMLQFSYSCDYYRERMKIFCGEDVLDNDEKVAEEFIRFIGAALGYRQ
ncbi:MAG: hypothetical protein H6Q59_2762 [Firmicutes bacterium]|nr:hypothetical protein [Bacillota bacterium]